MNMTRDRLQSIGWATLLALCAVLTGSLVLRVNSVKSQVEIAQRQIIALRHANQFLETEYETRANQQQLSDINDLDFGYKAPDSGQYIENERQLAMLGKPRSVDAPAPIEVASADAPDAPSGLGKLVPQLMAAHIPAAPHERSQATILRASDLRATDLRATDLRERLARIDPPVHRE